MPSSTPILGGIPAPPEKPSATGGLKGVLGKAYGLVPSGVRKRLRSFRSLPSLGARARYARLFLTHSVLGARWRYQEPEFPVKSVLFVCYGNIMRSAFAAAALQRIAEREGWELSVASAGTNARPGKPADPRARQGANAHGLSLESHRARLLDRKLVEDADLIVAMDYLNASSILNRFPDAAPRLVLLGSFAEKRTSLEVADPYGESDAVATACFEDIAGCVEALGRTIRKPR